MKHRYLLLGAACLAVSIATAHTAHGQATRTWVSGTGDDANPCSRTAPCKTFFGAYTKTAAGGEIDAMDPGGYGTLTITKAITIDGGGGQVASILASGTIGVNINAGSGDRVILRNLSINGAGTTVGTKGINMLAGGALTVEHCVIMNFSNCGIDFEPSIRANLVISDSIIDSVTTAGIISSASSGGVNRINIDRSTICRSGLALNIGQNSTVSIKGSFIANNAAGGIEANASTAKVTLNSTSVTNNQVFGLHALNNGIIRASETDVSDNNGPGLLAESSGQILSFGNMFVSGNNPDGSTTGTISPQ